MSKMRQCTECGAELNTPRSRTRYCSLACKNKVHNRRNGLRRRTKLRQRLQKIKMETGCVVCGYNKHPAALHFDHIDPITKSFSLGNNSFPIGKLEEEVAKCQVLCANCHAEKTWRTNHVEDE